MRCRRDFRSLNSATSANKLWEKKSDFWVNLHAAWWRSDELENCSTQFHSRNELKNLETTRTDRKIKSFGVLSFYWVLKEMKNQSDRCVRCIALIGKKMRCSSRSQLFPTSHVCTREEGVYKKYDSGWAMGRVPSKAEKKIDMGSPAAECIDIDYFRWIVIPCGVRLYIVQRRASPQGRTSHCGLRATERNSVTQDSLSLFCSYTLPFEIGGVGNSTSVLMCTKYSVVRGI